MYLAIIVVLICLSLWNWFRLDRSLHVAVSEHKRMRQELFSQAEAEIERLAATDEEIRRLKSGNAHLECALQERTIRLIEREREAELAHAENEILAMKLARAIWQNRVPEEACSVDKPSNEVKPVIPPDEFLS